MPVPKHKPTTSSLEGSTSQPSSPAILDQEEFRQHLRRLAVLVLAASFALFMRRVILPYYRNLGQVDK